MPAGLDDDSREWAELLRTRRLGCLDREKTPQRTQGISPRAETPARHEQRSGITSKKHLATVTALDFTWSNALECTLVLLTPVHSNHLPKQRMRVEESIHTSLGRQCGC